MTLDAALPELPDDRHGEPHRLVNPARAPTTKLGRLATRLSRRLQRRPVPPAPMGVPPNYGGSVSDLARMVIRGEFDAGRQLKAGTALVAILEAVADPVKPGPRPVIHLGIRKRKGCKDKIVIIDGFKEKSTGREAVKGSDPTNDIVARLQLTRYREQKLLRALFQQAWQDLLLADACEEYLNDHMPRVVRERLEAEMKLETAERGDAATAPAAAEQAAAGPHARADQTAGQRPKDKRRTRFETVAYHCSLFVECFPNLRLGDVRINIGKRYHDWRTGQQIRSQTERLAGTVQPADTKHRNVMETTALKEVEDLRMVLRYFYAKHGTDPLEFFMPDLEDEHGVEWLTGRELLRLLRVCRSGLKFDEFGALLLKAETGADGIERLVPDRAAPGEIAEFAAIERFILLDFYFGSRGGNVLDWRWGIGREHGGMDHRHGDVVRQGALARITTKRRGDATSAEPLDLARKRWFAGDKTAGFGYMVHDPLGEPLSYSRMLRLFKRVAENAGVPWARPHMLKHSAVTLFTHAGMSLDQVAVRFNTDRQTLEDTYLHLGTRWYEMPRVFRPENLKLINLVRFSPSRPLRNLADDAAA